MRADLIAAVRSALRDAAVPADAGPMQAYMKSAMPFWGVKKAARTRALRPVFVAHPLATDELLPTARALWDRATHREERYATLDLLRRREHRAHLRFESLPFYEHLIRSGAWWDLVDEIAAHQVGAILAADPHETAVVLRGWVRGDELWTRRTAILAQLRFGDRTDQELLADCLAPALEDRVPRPDPRTKDERFFLRKAVGWSLRQYARTDPDWVRRYLAEHEGAMSGLSKREAQKHLGSA